MPIGGIEELFQRLPVAIYRSAPDGELLEGNPALAELLGFESVEAMYQGMRNVESVYLDPSRRDVWLRQITESGVVQDFDVELRRRDGSTIWVQDTARAVFADDGSLLYCEGALVDVTDKVRARRARDEFVATVSHELRNPISVLLGLAQELANDYDGFSDEERREIAEVMASQADDASWIIEDLLVAHRGDGGGVAVFIESFDVVKEVERVLEGIDHPVQLTTESGENNALADPRRTRQILRNLVTNALRYGGPKVEVEVRRTGEDLEVAVRDDGPPLGPEEAERIFEPYQRGTASHDAKSVGLGLSVARKLAGLMNGQLVYSHDGAFSSFTLTIPADT